MQNKTILIIIVLLTVSVVIFLAGIVYLRTDRLVSNLQQQEANQQQSPQQLESEHVQRILEESGADLNTVGLVVYENDNLGREQLTFEKDPTESILVTVINRDPATVSFSIVHQPQSSRLTPQFSLENNQVEELEISINGEYVIQVEETGQKITLTVL